MREGPQPAQGEFIDRELEEILRSEEGWKFVESETLDIKNGSDDPPVLAYNAFEERQSKDDQGNRYRVQATGFKFLREGSMGTLTYRVRGYRKLIPPGDES